MRFAILFILACLALVTSAGRPNPYVSNEADFNPWIHLAIALPMCYVILACFWVMVYIGHNYFLKKHN